MENGIEGLARMWAFEAHKDQSYGPHSYRYHIDKVVEKVNQYASSADVIAAAYLHDGPEDTDMTIAEIQEKISYTCGEIVFLVTDPEGYDNRKERKAALYQRFENYDGEEAMVDVVGDIKKAAALVKGADRFCNQKETIDTRNKGSMKMYSREFPDFIMAYGPWMPKELTHELFDQFVMLQRIIFER